ncbi:MATE family efflux transporter [Lachnospiraceae bacterium NSJ-143]|nr:MATE family efflux transporter [Lachnospiraceae bacterium NSJ-143]
MENIKTNKNAITEGVIWKQLLIFFFPLLFGAFFQQMYNMADTIIVGRYLGKTALSAVGGSTGKIIDVIVYFSIGITSGASVIIAQYYGAKNYIHTQRSVHTAITFSALFGLTVSVVGFILTPTILKAIATPDDILAQSITYLRIYFIGMIPNLLYNMGAAVMRAVGDSKRPLIFLIITCFINIALDLLFVVGLNMGVAGAALATILSQLISATMVITALATSKDCYRFYINHLGIRPNLLLRMLRIGLPAGIQSLMFNVPNILLQFYVNLLGTDTVAAWSTYSKIETVFWMTIASFGTSMTTFAGQNYGAGRKDRVMKSVKECLAMAFAATVVISALLYTFSPQLFSLFITDPDVISIGITIMHFLPPMFVFYVCIEVLSGTLRGTGNSFKPMLLAISGVCLPRILWLAIVVPKKQTLITILVTFPLSWVITTVLFIAYFLHYTKKRGWWKNDLSKASQASTESVKA